jgi:hypothetical protein
MWVPPGYVTAFEAIEQIGRKKYGTEWTGNEKQAAGAPIPSQPEPAELDRISSSLATSIKYRPGANKQRANLQLMKESVEKKAAEYPIKLKQWLKGRPDAARWSGATDVLMSHLWTGQAVLWRLSDAGKLSRVDPRDLLLKNDLQHRLRTADGYHPACPTHPWKQILTPKYFDTLLVSGLELSMERAVDAPTDAGRSAKKNSGKQTAEKQQPARGKRGRLPKIDWDALIPDMEEIWQKNKDWTYKEAIEEMRYRHKCLEYVDDSIIQKRMRDIRLRLSE